MIVSKYLHRKKVVTNAGAEKELMILKSIFFHADQENTPHEPFTKPMAGGGLSGISKKHLSAMQSFTG